MISKKGGKGKKGGGSDDARARRGVYKWSFFFFGAFGIIKLNMRKFSLRLCCWLLD